MWGQIDTSNDERCREVRSCAKCSAAAVTVVHVTQHYNRGLPSGRTYQHRCGGCGVTFESISIWRTIVLLLSSGTIVIMGLVWLALSIGRLVDFGTAGLNGSFALQLGGGLLFFLGGLAWTAWLAYQNARLHLLHPVAQRR